MSDEDILKIGYWIDKIVKVTIGVFVAIAGFEYRNVKQSLEQLQDIKQNVLVEVATIKAILPTIEKRVEQIDYKTDRILERVK